MIAGSLADRIGLSQALIWTVPFPWIICAALFSLFYFTYPKDAKKLRALMAECARIIDLEHESQPDENGNYEEA